MNKYLKYEAADFAEDPDFIKWVQSDFEEEATNWNNFMEKNPGLGDEISEAIDIVELFHFEEKAAIPKTQKDNLLNRIHATMDADKKVAEVEVEKPTTPKPIATLTTPAHSTNTTTTNPKSGNSIMKFLLPIGAVACLLAFVFFNMGGESTASPFTKNTGFAETKKVSLPDQSIVNLNAASSLTFDKNNFSKNRTLQLEGEAFFNVEKGQRFTVETKNGQVEVLGTSFNVYSRNNFFHVECLTGKVKVTTKSGISSLVLTPNESVELHAKKLVKIKTVQKESDWTKGVYHFEKTPLSLVIPELERQFNLVVTTTTDIDYNKKFTGSFETKNLKDALHAVTWPMGFEYSIDEKENSGKKGVTLKVAK